MSRMIFVVIVLMGTTIILTNQLTSWPLIWKLAPAGGLLLLGFIALASSGSATTTAATPVATTTSTPTTDKTSPAEMLVTAILTLALVGGVAWFIGAKVIPFLQDTPNAAWVQNLPETRIVNNGFHRHDAVYPPLIRQTPFSQTVEAGRVYDTIEIEEGDFFRIQFDRPIDLRIVGSEDTIYTRHTDPGRYQATRTGTIQLRSETGRNHVQIIPSS